MCQTQYSSKMRASSKALSLAGVALAFGAALSVLLFVNASQHTSESHILLFGWLSITLILLSSLCLFFALVIFFRRITTRSCSTNPGAGLDDEYVAKYPTSDRVTALIIAFSLAALTLNFLFRSTHPWVIAVSAGLLIWSTINAAHVLVTHVKLTPRGFFVRRWWSRTFMKPYEEVISVTRRSGTIRVDFSDGCALKLHPGMGDSRIFLDRLRARCADSIHLE